MSSSKEILHERLMEAAIYAAAYGRVDKAAAIFENLIEPSIKKKVAIWLQNFTVITLDPINQKKFKYSKQAKIQWNENKARENPFWNIKLKTRISSENPKTTTDHTLIKFQIKTALNQFFKNPNLDTKINIDKLLAQYQINCSKIDRNSTVKFVSGGLPSLGKNR